LFAVLENLSGSYPATPEVIGKLRQELAGFAAAAGLNGEALDDVRLAVSEAVTNVVRHAYSGEPGLVHVTAGLLANELWILIADDGCGFNTPSTDPGLGMGLVLITSVCHEFALAERADGGTEARMRFLLGPGLRSADR
jgi:serine/threonine-protein kinase RsbW